MRSTEDGDFVHDRFLHSYDNDLAGQLGNLLNRTKSMIHRYLSGIVPRVEAAIVLDKQVRNYLNVSRLKLKASGSMRLVCDLASDRLGQSICHAC